MGGVADALSVDVERRFASDRVVAAAFDVEPRAGAMVVLFGPSGAGKSTVVRAIAGVIRPDRGRVQLGGDVWCDVASGRWVDPQQRRIGYVSQDPALFPHLTVAANVAYGIVHLPLAARREQTAAVIEALGLDQLRARYPRQLSGGEAQRVALARAVARTPRLLLLDEPFAALDEITRLALNDDLLRLWEAHRPTILFVTHSVFESVYLSTRIAVMTARPGQIAADLEVKLPQPRNRSLRADPAYGAVCERVSALLGEAMREGAG
jgi:NitT/TauT family transport system ATP-binding protein